MIWNKIIDKVFQLSNQKFSSNVIERCLTTSNEVLYSYYTLKC